MFHFVIITLHRDDFRVKLIDFGLAKELDANNRVRTGFAGTVGRTSFSRNSKVLWILDFPQYRGTGRFISISKQTKAISQVGFMAPEVANAQYKQDYASPASDLFSLGVAGHLIVLWITEYIWWTLCSTFSLIFLKLVDAKVIVYMLVSGGREPFWDGSDIRAIKNTLKKEVAIPLPQ